MPLYDKRRHHDVRFSVALSLLFIVGIWPSYTHAEMLPGSVDPGRLQERFKPQTEPRSVESPIAIEYEGAKAPLGSENLKFTLSSIVLDGATVFTPEELSELWRNKIGKVVTVKQIYDIEGQITAKYGNAGYILSQAIVPAQHISGGIVHIRVVEGFISHVTIEGDNTDRPDLIKAMTDKIVQSRPLRNEYLERYLLLIRDLPGMTAKGVLKPSPDQQGASELVVTLEQKPVDFSLSADNRGTRYVGPYELTAGTGFNSLLGLYDKTAFLFAATPNIAQLKYFDFSHSEIIDTEGTSLKIGVNYSLSQPGYVLKPEQLDNEAYNASLTASHPFILTRSERLTGTVSFVAEHSSSAAYNGATNLFVDNLRVLRVGAAYDFTDAWFGKNIISTTVSHGFNILGATKQGTQNPPPSREYGQSDFTKANFDLSRLQGLGYGFSLLGAVTAQYSPTSLLSAEEFGIGGSQFVRAYDPSEVTGQSGVATKIELAYSGSAEDIAIKGYQFFTYFDHGIVWDDHPFTGQKIPQSASAIGGGVRFSITDYFSGSLEISKPIGLVVATQNSRNPRGFFNLTAQF